MDRRMTVCNEGTTTSSGMQLATIDACIAQIKPPCATSQPHKITCVQFNDFGSQLLVNYMEDYLYLFNTAHLGRLVTLSHDDDDDKRRDRRAPLSSCNGGRSGVTPPVKRLRLRGDWSDTGPEARPNRDSDDPTSDGISFMNRMSNLFSHWIRESLSHGDDHTPTHSDADDSLHLSSEDDDEGEGSNPATPTESLTTAMASCSTESPQYNREDKATPTTEASRTMHFEPVQILEGNEGGRDDNDNIDYDRRGINNNCCHDNHPSMMYQGHRNARTMIKQANFWGDQFVMAGSDCGRVFLWDKYTGEIVNVLVADSHVVNCVQPHPHSCVLATSGIDYDIKLWEPMDDSPCELSDLDSIIKRNEEMLQESRNTITVPSSFILHILAYLNQRRRRRTHDEGNNDSSDED
jgi:nuclear receptor interaction protein